MTAKEPGPAIAMGREIPAAKPRRLVTAAPGGPVTGHVRPATSQQVANRARVLGRARAWADNNPTIMGMGTVPLTTLAGYRNRKGRTVATPRLRGLTMHLRVATANRAPTQLTGTTEISSPRQGTPMKERATETRLVGTSRVGPPSMRAQGRTAWTPSNPRMQPIPGTSQTVEQPRQSRPMAMQTRPPTRPQPWLHPQKGRRTQQLKRGAQVRRPLKGGKRQMQRVALSPSNLGMEPAPKVRWTESLQRQIRPVAALVRPPNSQLPNRRIQSETALRSLMDRKRKHQPGRKASAKRHPKRARRPAR